MPCRAAEDRDEGKDLALQCAPDQSVEILPNRARSVCGINLAGGPVLRVARILLLDMGTDQAGVDCKALATDQTLFHAAGNGHLEHMAQEVTLAEATVPVL